MAESVVDGFEDDFVGADAFGFAGDLLDEGGIGVEALDFTSKIADFAFFVVDGAFEVASLGVEEAVLAVLWLDAERAEDGYGDEAQSDADGEEGFKESFHGC